MFASSVEAVKVPTPMRASDRTLPNSAWCVGRPWSIRGKPAWWQFSKRERRQIGGWRLVVSTAVGGTEQSAGLSVARGPVEIGGKQQRVISCKKYRLSGSVRWNAFCVIVEHAGRLDGSHRVGRFELKTLCARLLVAIETAGLIHETRVRTVR